MFSVSYSMSSILWSENHVDRQKYWVHFWQKKSCRSVTRKPNILRPSRREVKIDVLKYLQHVVMGLNTNLWGFVDNLDRATSLGQTTLCQNLGNLIFQKLNRFCSVKRNVSSTRQAQGLDCDSVVWLRSSGQDGVPNHPGQYTGC